MEGTSATVVRLPNHLGDAVMALPALEALRPATAVVRRPLAPLIALVVPDVIPLPSGAAGFARTVRRLRAERPERGVLLTASFSSALLFAIGRVPERIGTATDRRERLLTEAIPPEALEGMHRAAAFWRIATGDSPSEPPASKLTIPPELVERWQELVPPADGPAIGMIPGGAAASRRWDPYRFATLGQRLAGQGARVIVFGGPGEEELTAAVAGSWALDLGGRTDLPLLAAGLDACDLVVSNDTGPLHLAAAVGTRTLSLWGAGDPAVTRPLGTGNAILRRGDLPCVPCVLNECPRSGAGYVLPSAERECMRLIRVDAVAEAVGRAVTLPIIDDSNRTDGWDGAIA